MTVLDPRWQLLPEVPGSWEERCAALHAARRAEAERWAAEIEAVLAQLAGSPSPQQRRELVRALGKRAELKLAPTIAALTRDPDPMVAAYAAWGLGRVCRADVAPELVRLTSHAMPTTRASAVWGLGRLAVPEHVPVLLDLAADPSEEVRKEVAGALAYVQDPRGLDGLVRLVRDADEEVRAEALRGLVDSADARALALLPELLGLAPGTRWIGAASAEERGLVLGLAARVLRVAAPAARPALPRWPELEAWLLELVRSAGEGAELDRARRAVTVACAAGDAGTAERLLELLPALQPELRVHVLSGLADLPPDAARAALHRALREEEHATIHVGLVRLWEPAHGDADLIAALRLSARDARAAGMLRGAIAHRARTHFPAVLAAVLRYWSEDAVVDATTAARYRAFVEESAEWVRASRDYQQVLVDTLFWEPHSLACWLALGGTSGRARLRLARSLRNFDAALRAAFFAALAPGAEVAGARRALRRWCAERLAAQACPGDEAAFVRLVETHPEVFDARRLVERLVAYGGFCAPEGVEALRLLVADLRAELEGTAVPARRAFLHAFLAPELVALWAREHELVLEDWRVVATSSVAEMVSMGEEPVLTCQRVCEATDHNAHGEPLFRVVYGQFKLLQLFPLGARDEAPLARALLELSAYDDAPQLLIGPYYTARELPRERLRAAGLALGAALGLAPAQVYFQKLTQGGVDPGSAVDTAHGSDWDRIYRDVPYRLAPPSRVLVSTARARELAASTQEPTEADLARAFASPLREEHERALAALIRRPRAQRRTWHRALASPHVGVLARAAYAERLEREVADPRRAAGALSELFALGRADLAVPHLVREPEPYARHLHLWLWALTVSDHQSAVDAALGRLPGAGTLLAALARKLTKWLGSGSHPPPPEASERMAARLRSLGVAF